LLQSQPNARLAIVNPFSADGQAAPIYFLGTGNFGGSVLKNAAPDRIKEILGVLNYFGIASGALGVHDPRTGRGLQRRESERLREPDPRR
jgi:hypothetical protein